MIDRQDLALVGRVVGIVIVLGVAAYGGGALVGLVVRGFLATSGLGG